jgi:hypothetical protein
MSEGFSEQCNVYIVRRADQKEWMAKAQEGEGIAVVCMRAAGQFMKDIPNEPLHCTCCEALFSPSNLPEAFIVLIPVKHDPDNFSAQTQGVCSECSKNDNRWIVDNGPKREGLSPTTARSGDDIH